MLARLRAALARRRLVKQIRKEREYEQSVRTNFGRKTGNRNRRGF